jgi:pimeloyl-ACP methyl ester carboxylesterase
MSPRNRYRAPQRAAGARGRRAGATPGEHMAEVLGWALQAALLLHVTGTLLFVLGGVVANHVLLCQRLVIDKALLTLIAREWAMMLWVLPALLVGLYQPPPPRGSSGARPPVLLVHGYGLNRVCFVLLERFLERRGFVVWSVNHHPRHGSVPEMARSLVRRIEALKEATGAAQVDVVGHSMGGVVTAWAAARLEAAADIRRLVTIGTPWRGTRFALFSWHPESRDMEPGAAVLEDILPPPVPTVSIWSPVDNVIIPPDSSAVPGAILQLMPGAGHSEMLLRPTIWRAVAQALAVEQLELLPGRLSVADPRTLPQDLSHNLPQNLSRDLPDQAEVGA